MSIHDQILDAEARGDQTTADEEFFRREPYLPPKCALVVDGVTVDLAPPVESSPSPIEHLKSRQTDQTRGQALNAFMDCLIERRPFSVAIRPAEISDDYETQINTGDAGLLGNLRSAAE